MRDIAEPLASFDQDYPANKARKFMADNGFDVVGVRKDGSIQGYVLHGELGEGTVGDHFRDIGTDDILREADPLLNALDSLKERQWIFIRFLGNPSGIVTRGDLQKAPVRMWLFGLISLLEMQMLRCIRTCSEAEDWWKDLLSAERIDMTNRLYEDRKRKNVEILLSDCLQLCDKGTIFKKKQTLFDLTGFTAKRNWKSFMVNIENLRNNLAHSNDLGSESWPDISNLAPEIEQVLESLEKRA